MQKRLFTSESVTEGHPDKICDQVSDAILDAMLAQDPMSRVACETLATTGLVMVAGEVTTNCYVDIEKLVRERIRQIGYDRAKYGFDCDSCAVLVSLKGQSPDIAMGVDVSIESREASVADIGAGDQGMVYGFACNETPEYMPMPIHLAHLLARQLASVRKSSVMPYLRPDGKTQVTVEYENGVPKRVDTIVLSTQHAPEVEQSQIEADVRKHILSVVPQNLFDKDTRLFINPTGRFVIGGPQGDCGLTGRKIIVDTYGGYTKHGGGAFSGKDPTKVDRSGAYMARYVAKNVVAAGLASRCEVEVAYAIGVAQPISVRVDTYGTAKVSEERVNQLIQQNFDLRPAAIIRELNLRQPIYSQTAAYGHFGRNDISLPWEALDKAELLAKG